MNVYDSGLNLTAKYVRGPGIDEPLAITTPAGTGFYEADALGSITSISQVQANGVPALLDSYRYDSFGNAITTTGTFPNTIQYTGREWDQDTGLYYYRARYYDPTIGRFLSEDPLRFGAGQENFYSYVGSNPETYSDPWGLCTKKRDCYAELRYRPAGPGKYFNHAFWQVLDRHNQFWTIDAGPSNGRPLVDPLKTFVTSGLQGPKVLKEDNSSAPIFWSSEPLGFRDPCTNVDKLLQKGNELRDASSWPYGFP